MVLLSTQVPDLAAAHTCAYPLVSRDRVCNLLSDLRLNLTDGTGTEKDTSTGCVTGAAIRGNNL